MTEPPHDRTPVRGLTGAGRPAPSTRRPESANLADILERVLDKGIVIAGDIQVNLLDIELLTIKLRLVIASVDRAKEMGIDWWEHDPTLSSGSLGHEEMVEENRRLRERLAAIEAGEDADDDEPQRAERRERRAVNRPEPRDRPDRSGRSDDRRERRSRRPPEGDGRG
ncbi:MAG: gas vesicle protein [Actinoallomurus sp.]